MSQIITFYSYKGGVGRSMALANVATLLSKWGKKVLMIDWDLEAPGLENFFKEYLHDTDWKQQKGVLEWLYAQQNDEKANWQDWVVKFKTKESKTDLHLLVSGKDNGNYSEMLRDFDVSNFYEKHDGGRRIEQFREELLAEYDYVLIDSRTGVTDFGGICTIQMPDILVMLFSPTEQGLVGTKKIAQRILDGHSKLPFDRYRLLICPVPSRFDSTTEFQESRKWLERISSELNGLYDNWLPANVNLNEFLQIIKIPYISYFSYGEKLPVIEQGVSDPAGLGYAYENLAMLLGRGLDEVDEFVEKREVYLEEASGIQTLDIKNHERLPSGIAALILSFDRMIADEIAKHLVTQGVVAIQVSNPEIVLGMDIKDAWSAWVDNILKAINIADILFFVVDEELIIQFSLLSNNEVNKIAKKVFSSKIVIPLYASDDLIERSPYFLHNRLGETIGSDMRLSQNQFIKINQTLKLIAEEKRQQ